MKKAFTLVALACAAMGMNAEVFEYDNNAPLFFPYLQAPVSEFGLGVAGNFDILDKTGMPKVEGSQGKLLQEKDAAGNWVATEPRCRVSLDELGGAYYLDPADGLYKFEGQDVLNEEEPFIGYGDKGPSRVIWMYGWDNTSGYEDKDYGAASEEDWVSTRHGIQFGRNANSGVRQDTYIQFPAGKDNATLTVYASHAGSSYTTALDVKVVPVIDGVDQEPFYFKKALKDEITGEVIARSKRFYKFSQTYNNPGKKKLAFKVGCNGSELNLHHVTIETGVPAVESGIEDIIVNPATDENAPIYNVLGIQVDENYKGIVIKNGKKYIRK